MMGKPDLEVGLLTVTSLQCQQPQIKSQTFTSSVDWDSSCTFSPGDFSCFYNNYGNTICLSWVGHI